MDRRTVIEHLAQAERHVAEGERHIARQREIVAELARGGGDARASEQLLGLFEEVQALHIADRDRLFGSLVAMQ